MKGNKFNLNSLLNQSSKAQSETKLDAGFRIEYISVNDLIPAEENFYDVEHIENLKQGIELNGGIKQNLIVTPSEIDGKYRIIAGHRRHKASKELVDEGKKEYDLLPCIVESEIDTDKEQLMLIMTNSTTRELTDFEKTKQAEILKDILVKLKKKENITGRVREIIADILNTSPAQISRMESINKNLSEEFKDKFKEQKIGISAAYELSKKPKDEQKKVLEEYKESGDIKLESKKEIKTETLLIKKDELKRLSEIGKATEKAFKDGYTFCFKRPDGTILECIKNIEELMEEK